MRGQEVGGADAGGVAGELYHMVDEMRERAGLPMPRVYVGPQQAPNAFARPGAPRREPRLQ